MTDADHVRAWLFRIHVPGNPTETRNRRIDALEGLRRMYAPGIPAWLEGLERDVRGGGLQSTREV